MSKKPRTTAMVAGRYLVIAALGAGFIAPASPGWAQNSGAQGIRAGSFIFEPVFNLSGRYDSNIFQQTTGGKGSFITTVSPQLRVSSDFSRHRVEANLGYRQEFFHQSSDDNTQTHFADVKSTLDITRQFRVKSTIAYRRQAERRGSDEISLNAAGLLVSLAGPVYSDSYGAELRVQYDPGDLRIEPFVFANQRDFIDRGPAVNQDDRDRRTFGGGLEVGYQLVPGYEAFIRTTYFDVDFQQAVDDAGLNRDNTGIQTLAGVNLKLSRLISGSVGFGAVFNQFEDPAFQNSVDFTAEIGLNWTPRRRWNITLDASRDLQQTNVAGASDKTETDVTLGVRYQVTRDVGGFLRTGLNRSEFSGTATTQDRTDTGYFGGFGVDWDVTRRASLRGTYNFQQEFSTLPSQEFTKHVGTIGIRYGL